LQDGRNELIVTLAPAVKTIKEALEADSEAWVSVDIYGTVTQDLMTTVAGLKKHQYVVSDGDNKDPYDASEKAVINRLPMLHGDSIGIYMSAEIIQFLASIKATFESDISIIINEDQSWDNLRKELAKQRKPKVD
jgi:hypothetical protein